MAEFIRRSRLERKNDEQVTKRTIAVGVLTVALLIAIVVFGLPFLVKFAVFLGESKTKTETNTTNESTLPPLAPRLSLPFEATNSAQITIMGVAEPKTKVELLNNEITVATTDVGDSGDFSFDGINLTNGDNKFSAVAISTDGVRSTVSTELNVSYDTTPPPLDLTTPNEETLTVDKPEYEIAGKSEKGASVTVNDRIAAVDSDGNFKLTYQLDQGKNELTITAADLAGNLTTKKVTITYDF